jgi:hypothetical protein
MNKYITLDLTHAGADAQPMVRDTVANGVVLTRGLQCSGLFGTHIATWRRKALNTDACPARSCG